LLLSPGGGGGGWGAILFVVLIVSIAEKTPALNFVPNIVKYLHQLNVETFTAPYQGRAQLAHLGGMTSLGQMPLLHNIWGPLELLLFNIPNVITDIDFTVLIPSLKSYSYLSRNFVYVIRTAP